MNDKVALITGSSTGLGRRTAIELAKEGIHIALNYVHSEERALQLKQMIEQNYQVKTIAVQGDVSRYEEAERIVSEAMEKMGHVDILVNNAGPYIAERKDLIDYSVEEWKWMMDGNVNSVFYLSKLIIPHMRKKRWGRILNFGFDRADHAPGWRYRSAFAAAKVGLVSLTKTLALEEAEYGITVNMVCPGDIIEPYKELSIKDVRSIHDPTTPVGRPGTGEDIARVIAFLCDSASDFLTGNVIQVTGAKDVLTKYRNEG